MKKSIKFFLLMLILVVSLAGCGINQENVSNEESSNNAKETVSLSEKRKKVTVGIQEFENLLESQELKVVSTKYIVQDEQYKALYPDVLQVILQNDTAYDIKHAMVAFVAWDKNNLPVKIKGSMGFSDGSYVKNVSYNDINLVPGEQYGSTSGYEVDEDCGIASFKAIVVSYESFTGETWENPYYDSWCKLYEGTKYSEDLTVEMKMK